MNERRKNGAIEKKEVDDLQLMKIMFPLIGLVVGGAVGYGYYKFVGCHSGG